MGNLGTPNAPTIAPRVPLGTQENRGYPRVPMGTRFYTLVGASGDQALYAPSFLSAKT